MLLDMTFRFEIADHEFADVQLTLAECANQVQRDRALWTGVKIPHNEGERFSTAQGFLVEVKPAFT